ncbi:MAG: hypothetical protein ACOY0T_36955 [Myxococcota bacterium]
MNFPGGARAAAISARIRASVANGLMTGSPPSRDSAPEWAHIDAVVQESSTPDEYARWLAQTSAPSDDYLFSKAVLRFGLRDGDRLVAPPDLQVTPASDGAELVSGRLGGALRVAGVSAPAAQRVCSLIDGNRTCAEIKALSGAQHGVAERLLAAAFGRIVFAPSAIATLEARISGTELVRFVSTPYEVERSYWENMADVRELTGAALDSARDATEFVHGLRRLHVVALLGASLQNFYRPASRISARSVGPGTLYTSPSRTHDSADGCILLEGPRVGVPFVGGYAYHALVCAHDPAALEPNRQIVDAAGLSWGRVVHGRAADEIENRAWFLPPRPAQPEHFASVFDAYRRAREAATRSTADASELVRALSQFHFRFVRLHPFRCANQSLSMNLVNRLLREATGKSMPHSLLDQFALRLSQEGYETVFARAVTHTSGSGTAGERWAELRRQTASTYALIERLQTASTAEDWRRISDALPEAARAALIG